MPPSEASFALLQPPSFDVVPDTDVQLGSIHPRTKTRPRRPDTRAVLNRTSRVPVPTDLYRSRTDPVVILDDEKLRSGGGGIKVHLPLLQGVAGDANAERSNDTILYVDARNVETRWFLPDDDYFKQLLKSIVVREELLNFRTPSVFLVTGVKIAESATILTGYKKTTTGDLGPEIDLTGFGIPIDVGASINAKRRDYRIVPIKKTKFVLAFETRRIKIKKDAYSEQLFNDFAMLDDEQDDAGAIQERLYEIFDWDEVTTEVQNE